MVPARPAGGFPSLEELAVELFDRARTEGVTLLGPGGLLGGLTNTLLETTLEAELADMRAQLAAARVEMEALRREASVELDLARRQAAEEVQRTHRQYRRDLVPVRNLPDIYRRPPDRRNNGA